MISSIKQTFVFKAIVNFNAIVQSYGKILILVNINWNCDSTAYNYVFGRLYSYEAKYWHSVGSVFSFSFKVYLSSDYRSFGLRF